MKPSPIPSAAAVRSIDRAPDPRIHAADRPQNPLPPSPPDRAKRRPRSAFIEAIAEFMATPVPASHGQEVADPGTP